MDFSPIPAQSAPVNLIKTTEKSTAEENHTIKLGMKLNSSLKPGNYENKLIISVVSNPYTPKAIMIEGPGFNNKLRSLETTTDKIEHFKKSTVAPAASMNAVNIEDEESDYEIKLWLDPTDKTAYYYTEPEKVYLNTYVKFMFSYMRNLTTLDLSSFNTSNVTDMSYMFDVTPKLATLDLSNFDTSQVTTMSHMFYSVSSLTTLNLSNFDTSNVTDMSGMFYGMANLTTLDLSSFDTSMVISMQAMFERMYNLTTLNLSNFNTSNVTNMGEMFFYIHNLTSLDLSNFDTSKVTDMQSMFNAMSNITILDLSSFDTSKVTNMMGMFANMSNLTSLDLSNFDTSMVTDMKYMFYLDNEDIPKDKLETIYVNNDFNTSKLKYSSRMFENRKKLRGGNGSYLADPSTADKTWLRIDDPTNGRPGYFTRKP